MFSKLKGQDTKENENNSRHRSGNEKNDNGGEDNKKDL